MLPTDQQPIATCTSYIFLHGTTVLLMKLIFYMKNKKTVHLKLQHRITKKNSFSRYLENDKSRNVFVTTFVWYCLSSRPELFCKKGVLRNFPKLTGKHLRRSVFLKKFLSQRPAALFKRDSSTGVFSRILRDFLEHLLCIWLSYVMQKRCSKNPAKFTAKLMWTAASGISENRPCMADCKFIDVLQNWLQVSM